MEKRMRLFRATEMFEGLRGTQQRKQTPNGKIVEVIKRTCTLMEETLYQLMTHILSMEHHQDYMWRSKNTYFIPRP